MLLGGGSLNFVKGRAQRNLLHAPGIRQTDLATIAGHDHFLFKEAGGFMRRASGTRSWPMSKISKTRCCRYNFLGCFIYQPIYSKGVSNIFLNYFFRYLGTNIWILQLFNHSTPMLYQKLRISKLRRYTRLQGSKLNDIPTVFQLR